MFPSRKKRCISKDYKEVVANYRAPWLHKYELDIYLQDYKIGIEYDGVYGHSSTYGVARDCRKNQNCYENGVTLLRIREHGCPPTESTSIDYIIPEGESLNNTIFTALNLLDNLSGQEHNRDKESIDVERYSGEIYSLIDYSEKENSLQNKAPEIAAMWHPDKNGKLTPEYV